MDGQCCGGGVRFRLFPKPPYVHPEWPPETISVSRPPGSIGPGPADERMRLIFPIDKRYSYGVNPGPLGTPKLDLPPYRGLIHRPVCPDDEGNFDTIPVGTPRVRRGACVRRGAVRARHLGTLFRPTHRLAFRPRLPPARDRHRGPRSTTPMPAMASWKSGRITFPTEAMRPMRSIST